MKIVHEEVLVKNTERQAQREIDEALDEIRKAIIHLHWPKGSGQFTIFPESGKSSGKGNGVRPIRDAFTANLSEVKRWKKEQTLDLLASRNPGKVDVIKQMNCGSYCVEWETGNISSCHRSLNKMSLGLIKQTLTAATVVVPSRKLYHFLTDRIANYDELIPYLELWKMLPVSGYLSILVAEHDMVSESSPRIPKGTDGMSAAGKISAQGNSKKSATAP